MWWWRVSSLVKTVKIIIVRDKNGRKERMVKYAREPARSTPPILIKVRTAGSRVLKRQGIPSQYLAQNLSFIFEVAIAVQIKRRRVFVFVIGWCYRPAICVGI